MNALWKVWNDHDDFLLPETGYSLKGFSIAALRTNFYIKELDVMFDAGISGYMSPDHIFITHTHGDHIANIPFHILAPKPGKKIQVYIPKESMDVLEKYIGGLYKANDFGNPDASDEHYYTKNYDLIGVTAGEALSLEIKGRSFSVEIINCDHSVPCVGYGFSEIKHKLKKEYLGSSSREIKLLKESNVEITDSIHSHVFCFLGDTSKEIIKEDIGKYKTIIMECTFINKEELERAELTKHTHWLGIEQYILDHPQNTFVLYHFSQRYKRDYIQKFFTDIGFSNVHAWISNV
jgi:ribonuclease Z